MDREPVISRIISEIGYNGSCRTLEILFKTGATRLYYFVPEEVHRDLMNAASHGTYFTQNIDDIYDWHQIAEPYSVKPKRRRKKP